MPADRNWDQEKAQLEELKLERASWDSHYKELQEYFLPRRGRWIGDMPNRGDRRNQKQIDPTPTYAARITASGMMAGLTSPARPWFRLATPDPDMMEFPAVRHWLYTVETRMRDVFQRSNLYKVLPQCYLEGAVFGTAPMLIIEDPATTIRCQAMTVGSYYLAQNEAGMCDTIVTQRKFTVRQACEFFGDQNLSPATQGLYRDGKMNQWVDIAHFVGPRPHAEHGRADAKNMPWRSTYWEEGFSDKPVRESGFEGNPVAALRWDLSGDDVYGSSPAMIALGAANALQVQQKRKAAAIDKHIDPPMVGDPAMQNQQTTLLPGGVTWAGFTATGAAPRFQPAYLLQPNLTGMLADIADLRGTINQAMYVDMFLMFASSDRREVTAEEIARRHEEKLLMLGPVLENHKHDVADRIIERTFDLMLAQGMVPDPPDELQGVNLKVELISILAQAQRLVATTGMERFTQFVAGVAKSQADAGEPVTAFDKLDADQLIDEYAEMTGVPPTVVRSDDDVEILRQNRAQQQAQAQMAAAAAPIKDAASAAKMASETQVNGQPMLDQIMQQMAGRRA